MVFYAGMRNLNVADLLDIDQKAVAGIKIEKLADADSDRS